MTRTGKKFIIAVAVVIVLTFFISPIFIMAEADHECTGEDCHICRMVETCISAIGKVSLAVLLVLFAVTSLCLVNLNSGTDGVFPAGFSLVNHKVKLSI